MPTEIQPKKTENGIEFLPYEFFGLTDEQRKTAKLELFEDEETKIHSLKLFRSMMNAEENLHYQDEDDFLISFLRARKYDVKRAVTLMKTFYHTKDKHIDLYGDFNYEDCTRTFNDNSIGYLPYRDPDGCVILVLKTGNWNIEVNTMGDFMRALTTALFHAIEYPATQVSGFKVIVDFKGFTLSHLSSIAPKYLWLFAEALQNCFPARFKAIHVVNEGHFWSYVWTILKQFMSKKMKDRFHFHGKNVDKLHKYFPRSILCEEWNGELPPFNNKEWVKKCDTKADDLTFLYSHGYNVKRKGSH